MEKNILVEKEQIKKNSKVSIINNIEEMFNQALKKNINHCERLFALNKTELEFQKEKLAFEKARKEYEKF